MINELKQVTVIKSNKKYFILPLSIIWFYIVSLEITRPHNFSKIDLILTGEVIVFILITLGFIYEIMWFLFGKTIITITDEDVSVTNGIFFLKETKNYKKDHISDIRINYEQTTFSLFGIKLYNTWGFQGSYFNDSKNPVLIFNYNKQIVKITSNLAIDDMEILKKQLN
jgi:hypothetical protein